MVNQQLQEQRLQINEIIKDLHQLTLDIGNGTLAQTVNDLRDRINEPFMFVIVGEVKAGKSSFINALLASGKEICKVAPDPCTDTIQQIIYGDEEKTLVLNDYLHKIFLPVDILQDIAIVDTPGTNTIVKHHQEVTERFIPGSDLIVFVFEAKNPYRQSAWEFFDFIHGDWHKKVIFILQQSDLMEPDDLEVNINGVKRYAIKKGITEPNVFAVSAKQELNGKIAESGFLPVRGYIQDNITGGKAPLLKLRNNINTAQNIGDKISDGLDVLNAQHKADQTFREDIRRTLNDQESFSNNQVDLLVENLVNAYERTTKKTGDELRKGLGFFSLVRRSIQSVFFQKTSVQDWLEGLFTDLGKDLNGQMHKKLNEGVLDIADSIQRMVKMIDLKIQNSETILKNNHEIFGDLADQRSSVLRDLQTEFSEFMSHSDNFLNQGILPTDSSFSPDLAAGSGIAVIGVMLATVTQGMVFDITGGVISALGLVFAGVTTSMKRRKIIQQYNSEIDKGKDRLRSEISEKLKAYIQDVKKKVDANFRDFDIMLEIEQKKADDYTNRHRSIDKRLRGLEVGTR